MQVSRFTFALLAGLATLSAPALAGASSERVLKVDQAHQARAQGNGTVTIDATGAVSTGGWQNPHLHVAGRDGDTLVLEFMASPPSPGEAVIQETMPVSASAALPARAATHIKIESQTNAITIPVSH